MSNKTLSSRGRQEAQSKRAGRFRGSSINLFYLPAVILLAVFIVYPLFSGIGLSLTNWDGYSPEKTFIGLTNFAQMFKDANFRLILINTLIYGVGSTAIQQVLGLGLALLLNSKIRGATCSAPSSTFPHLWPRSSWVRCTTSSSSTSRAR